MIDTNESEESSDEDSPKEGKRFLNIFFYFDIILIF